MFFWVLAIWMFKWWAKSWCHLRLMEGLFLLMCAMKSSLKSNMMWFLLLCLFTMLHNKLTWLWRFYISISCWLTTLKNYLLKNIYFFFNMRRELLSLKDLLLYSILNLFCNVKTCWLSMIFLAKGVLVEYKSFIM